MSITGELFIAGERVATSRTYQAVDPSTGEALGESFSIAGSGEVARACEAAEAAFASYSATAPEDRARFLEAIADNLEGLGDALLERGVQETGLPTARLTGERGRTANQLRLFAGELRDGGYEGVRIDSALPDREPARCIGDRTDHRGITGTVVRSRKGPHDRATLDLVVVLAHDPGLAREVGVTQERLGMVATW